MTFDKFKMAISHGGLRSLSTFYSLMFTAGWVWKKLPGQRMINKVANTFQVGLRLHCMNNCTVSPICDSYNYRPSDNTCQLNTL